MIQRLRLNFILIASGCVAFIIAMVLLCLNGVTYYSTYSECMSILDYITEHNGRMPDRNPDSSEVDFYVSRELRFETRYFSIVTDSDGNFIASDDEFINDITLSDMKLMYSTVSDKDKNTGILVSDDSYFLFRVKDIDDSELNDLPAYDTDDFGSADGTYRLILFMDCTNRFYRLKTIRIFSLVNGLSLLAIFIILISFLSERAVRPFAVNYEKQKQFITNAGHELKTPLAVISANAEVLEAVYEKSEWTESILNQVKRLSDLVNNLITISKLDETAESNNTVMTEVGLSKVVAGSCDDFKTVAAQQGKTLEADITENITLSGNEKMLRELSNILIDNAIKYCDDGGSIRVELKQHKNRADITISNTYVKETDCTRFFDRFYRGDTSHNSEKSGYGIGLSMAQAIVRAHKGRISAYQKDGRVYIKLLF